MKIPYSSDFEIAMHVVKSILKNLVEYETDGIYKNVEVVLDNQSKTVNDILYNLNRTKKGNFELSSILPICSLKLTEISPIPEFKFQKNLKVNRQYTPIITKLRFNGTYWSESFRTILNIYQQLITTFDIDYNVNVNYENETVQTHIGMPTKTLQLKEEMSEDDIVYHKIEFELTISPIFVYKHKADYKQIDITVRYLN